MLNKNSVVDFFPGILILRYGLHIITYSWQIAFNWFYLTWPSSDEYLQNIPLRKGKMKLFCMSIFNSLGIWLCFCRIYKKMQNEFDLLESLQKPALLSDLSPTRKVGKWYLLVELQRKIKRSWFAARNAGICG